MDEVKGAGAPWDDAAYSLELRAAAGSAEIAIIRIDRDRDRAGTSAEVWSHPFGSVGAARKVFAIMYALPARWAAWGRMAAMLGSDFLDGVIETEVLTAAVRSEQGFGLAPAASRRTVAARAADSPVRMRLLVGHCASRVVASCGGRRFMTLGLVSPSEARRVWDWVRWQSGSYQRWFSISERQGRLALARLIVESVLDAERRAGEAGVPSDRDRRLRHWRPRSGRCDFGPHDEGPDEIFG